MRPVFCIAFALLLAAPAAVPAYAAEPDAPDALIGRTEAIRIAIQERLSEKFTSASEVRKDEQGALVEYYAVPENRLLWVDENGFTDRGQVGDGGDQESRRLRLARVGLCFAQGSERR